jgi:hypothetical protein
MRQYRASNPTAAAVNAARQAARERAMRRLAQLHRRDMRRLYVEELRKAGLDG